MRSLQEFADVTISIDEHEMFFARTMSRTAHRLEHADERAAQHAYELLDVASKAAQRPDAGMLAHANLAEILRGRGLLDESKPPRDEAPRRANYDSANELLVLASKLSNLHETVMPFALAVHASQLLGMPSYAASPPSWQARTILVQRGAVLAHPLLTPLRTTLALWAAGVLDDDFAD